MTKHPAVGSQDAQEYVDLVLRITRRDLSHRSTRVQPNAGEQRTSE
jgi:hypothetical protein